jgi:hypothetical protein
VVEQVDEKDTGGDGCSRINDYTGGRSCVDDCAQMCLPLLSLVKKAVRVATPN